MKLLLVLVLSCLVFAACDKDNEPNPDYLELIADIPSDTYSQADVFQNVAPEIYGAWEVIGSSGGLAGTGYEQDFDVLLIKPNDIFGVVRNDSLLTTGQIFLGTDTLENPLV